MKVEISNENKRIVGLVQNNQNEILKYTFGVKT